MLRVAICDDNEIYLKNNAKIVARECEEYSPEISLFPSGVQLLKELKKGFRPEILLLDIVLEENESGINVAKEVNRLCPGCGIIFLTSFIAYASDVYEAKHSYFIVKSQLEQRIKKAVRKTLAESRDVPCISFSAHNSTIVLPAREVTYLERRLKKTIIFHYSGHQYETYSKPSEIVKDIRGIFVQCHQSFVVNMAEIATMEGDSFLLRDGTQIPISRSRKKETKETFHSFISNAVAEI